MVRLKKPAPGRHIWQVPSVVKVPLPDRVVPESAMWNISAVSGTEDNVLNAMAFGYYPVGEWYLHDGRNLPDVSLVPVS